jgi:hypothetical protein
MKIKLTTELSLTAMVKDACSNLIKATQLAHW